MTIILAVESPLCRAAKRHFTVADDIALVQFRQPFSDVTDPDVFSPNGKYFAVNTERGLLRENRPEATIRIFNTDDVQRFLLHPGPLPEPLPIWTFAKSTYKDGPVISQIRWLADSSGFGFLAKSVSGNDQLFLADMKTRRVRSLTPEDQFVTGFDIRDRKHIVYCVQSSAVRAKIDAEKHATSLVATGRSIGSLLFPDSIARFYDLSELWAVVDGRRFRVESNSMTTPVHLYSTGTGSLALSPDGRSLVTTLPIEVVPPEWETLYPPPQPNSPYRIRARVQDLKALDGSGYVNQYVLIDLPTGRVKELVAAPTGEAAGWFAFTRARWSLDGQSVVLSNTFPPAKQSTSQNHANLPCVGVLNLRDSRVSCLEYIRPFGSEGYRLVENAYFEPGVEDRIIVTYEAEERSRGVEQKSTEFVRSRDGSWAPSSSMTTISRRTRISVFVKQGLDVPPVLVATDNRSAISRTIWNPNPELQEIDLGEASMFRWKDVANRDWIGGLYKPPDYVVGHRYPLVIQTHGFAPNFFLPSGLFPTAFAARELSAFGMVVLQVQDCSPSNSAEEGLCSVSGYESAIKELAAEGLVDPDNVGIVGFSRSCYYVLKALTTIPQRFKAGSITEGFDGGYFQYILAVSDNSDEQLGELEIVNDGRPFGHGLQQWLRRSPGFNMDKVRTPLQVVGKGPLSLLGEWESYATLRALNKPVDLIMLAEGAHVLSNPAERLASQGGTVDWFRFWLKGEEDPDPAKGDQYKRWRELRKLQEENEKNVRTVN